MRFVFPFPTTLQIKIHNSLKYLGAYLVSSSEDCSIRYTYLDNYDMSYELDSFRILAEFPMVTKALDTNDHILLDTWHDSIGGRSVLTEHESKQCFKINVPEEFSGDFASFNDLPAQDLELLRGLNSVKASCVMLDPDNYMLSLMKEIILKNALLEDKLSINEPFQVHKDLFDGPFYLPHRIAVCVHESFRPDMTNRTDTLPLIVPKSYRVTP